jgi:hypothetical protein
MTSSSKENARNNAMFLLKEVARLTRDKDVLSHKLENMPASLANIEKIDKLEEELKELNAFIKNLMNQAVVIINENNLENMPSLEEL